MIRRVRAREALRRYGSSKGKHIELPGISVDRAQNSYMFLTMSVLMRLYSRAITLHNYSQPLPGLDAEGSIGRPHTE